ncbi:MAG TPA: Uma2 family endonuclease [Candidatus Eremiobacteraceae bacterium]|nr:Uma2 family endonuclease [Candidatus Eremiobacteraceae bacterium]
MRDIVLPEVKPALEWIGGRAVQKVSPQRKHALAQTRFAMALEAWARAGGRGTVGTEWEFRLKPAGEARRPLVPDVAFISFERLPYEDEAASDIPHVAPEVVVEVLSPNDRRSDIEEKIRVYLECGTAVMFLVDTESQTVTIRDASRTMGLSRGDILSHHAMPGFSLRASELFDRISPRP